MSVKDFVSRLNIVDPNEITLRLKGEEKVLFLKYRNLLYRDVVPERPFPISHPEFVILKNAQGVDIFTVKDMRKLNRESRVALKEILDTLYFIPKIVKISRLEATGDKVEWETETKRGKRTFTTRGRRSIVVVDNKMVISDEHDNLYQIENIEDLDEKSKKIIESSF